MLFSKLVQIFRSSLGLSFALFVYQALFEIPLLSCSTRYVLIAYYVWTLLTITLKFRIALSLPTSTLSRWPLVRASTTTFAPSRGRMALLLPGLFRIRTSRVRKHVMTYSAFLIWLTLLFRQLSIARATKRDRLFFLKNWTAESVIQTPLIDIWKSKEFFVFLLNCLFLLRPQCMWLSSRLRMVD